MVKHLVVLLAAIIFKCGLIDSHLNSYAIVTSQLQVLLQLAFWFVRSELLSHIPAKEYFKITNVLYCDTTVAIWYTICMILCVL